MNYEEFIKIGGYDVIKKEYIKYAFISVGGKKIFSQKNLNNSHMLQQYIKFYGADNYKKCVAELNNRVSKQARITKILARILNSNKDCYFVTFTLNNDYISKDYKLITHKLTKIARSCCDDFIINADFGKKNNRLHFHGVLASTDIENLKASYFMGFLDYEKIFTDTEDTKALVKYLYKLRNHATKQTTKYRIITKRKSRC